MRYHLPILLIAAMLIVGGCVSGPRKIQTVDTDPVFTSTHVPAIKTATSDKSTIIGEWQNGMVFYANGSVGSDGITSWHTNGNTRNSYFVIRDEPSAFDRGRNVTSTEWIYIPESDCIHRRGSPVLIYRKTG